ncbi:hypothetical protein TNCT_272891 [Trichonephila clavata]|uniref:Secreted protein n=1 Tax=Trichonephila clavata TaxID=2740835 RepID=A0A8X6L859_TRICU|nr:hypothetical protein TNCT_272891 [Trichonephila clavata]
MTSALRLILYLSLFVPISIRNTNGDNTNPQFRHISEFSDPNSGFNPFIDLEEGIAKDTRPSFLLIDRKNDVDEVQTESWKVTLWNSLLDKTPKNDQEHVLKKKVLAAFFPSDNEKQNSDTFLLKISTETISK